MSPPLTLFCYEAAALAELRDALHDAAVEATVGSLDDPASIGYAVRLVTLDPERVPDARSLESVLGERFLHDCGLDDSERFRLADALLPARPERRHRIALHAGACRDSALANTGELPGPLIDEGAAGVRHRLALLAEMRVAHVFGPCDSAQRLAVLARAATDCSVAVGSTAFAMQIVAYRRVRGWIPFRSLERPNAA